MAENKRRDAAIAAAASGTLTPRQTWVVLIGLMSGMFLAALDQSVVATAIRTIADDLQGLSMQAWATTAYLITSTVVTPIYGKLSDIYGRRPLYITAILIFVVGSFLIGFATSMPELAAFRAIQGLGAGGLFSLALTILADIVPPRERAKYQGLFIAVFGTSSVLGPLIGGLFASVDKFLFIDGWRWVFLINVPIGLISLAMVMIFLHVPHTPRPSRIDWGGAITIVLAVVPVLLVAEQGNEWGWASALTISLLTLSAVATVGFILIEKRMGDAALIPLHIFKNQTFARTQLLGVLMGVGMFGGMIVLPLVLQIAYGANPTQAGLLMLPMVLGMMIASITSGRITSTTGKYRIFFNVGTAILTIGYIYLAIVLDADQAIWVISIGMILLGLGLGQIMQTQLVASQNAVEARDIGVATSTTTFFRQMGGTLGVAVFLSILFSQLSDRIGEAFERPAVRAALDEALADRAVIADLKNRELLNLLADSDAAAATSITSDSSFLIGADERLTAPFRIGFVEAATWPFVLAAIVVAVAFVVSWFIRELPLRTKSAAQENAEAAASE